MSAAHIRPFPSRLPCEGFGGVLVIFLRPGPTSFGGPVAHLGLFPSGILSASTLAERKAAYADRVVPCQFLPGPASAMQLPGSVSPCLRPWHSCCREHDALRHRASRVARRFARPESGGRGRGGSSGMGHGAVIAPDAPRHLWPHRSQRPPCYGPHPGRSLCC